MNPSATGWINKLISISNKEFSKEFASLIVLYKALIPCGYIYGSNTKIINDLIDKRDFSSEEICKINHLIALYVTHNSIKDKINFVENTIQFYKKINAHKTNFFLDILSKGDTTETLEKIIHKRIQIDNNLIDKSFNYFITNALLFIDVLAYKQYLTTGTITEASIIKEESAIETIVLKTLNSKIKKTKYDNSLIDLFEQSLRYQQTNKLDYNEAISVLKTPLEKQYILDLACMATWSDKTLDDNERYFLFQLGKDLNLEAKDVKNAMHSITDFFAKHKKDIVLLGSKNIVKTFYNNSSAMVMKLISRNSKRLQKELSQSKELMLLLTKSTGKDLTKEEQKKVNDQLLDIFKAIPSLAIFLLPGGALLLPLVIKFIPKLLPSAFDDNRIED
ncbi:LETM1-related biofilm-associated protein [Lacinutrix jangbogonensis]|uniref:LETM1-related biofilm-associated protein n=1 Tax=Lacinutrix jangbogonensis TaxID=1469557 RepID=UPI00053D9F31|nr:LETM1-related biofilm-associated protein [Lacinutrix jangbogonensis]